MTSASPRSVAVQAGAVVWTPPSDVREWSKVGRFLDWLRTERGLDLEDHEDLWQWSVTDLEGFWSAIWDYFDVATHRAPDAVLPDRRMPGTKWFPGALLNYAEHLLGTDADRDRTAILGRSQTRADVQLSFGELRDQVARARVVLRALGVRRGDRVVGYLPNVPEALVAFLATASLGAIWAACASEFGATSVTDRFAQLDPTVLLVAGGYQYGGKRVDLTDRVAEIRGGLPTVRQVIDIRYGDHAVPDALAWPELLAAAEPEPLTFEPVPFDHPLFVLFSSGTTGKPKAIVHGHGGILLEHLKNHAFSWDLGPDDRMLWFSTTAWMMWNALVSSLLLRASIVMVDGNPMHPDVGWQWRLAQETRATVMGASPGFVMASRAAALELSELDLAIRVVGSAGAPLPPEGYAWIYHQLGPDVLLNVGSGGTDVCSGLVQNNPLLPVRAGAISGRCLGVAAYAFDEQGREVVGAPGELVITEPMPSMPVAFWGDPDGSRLQAAYFDHFTGIWRHGDWIVFWPDGSCVVTGRSDATLNRGGVRLGTAEFYRVVEELHGVADSLVVHLEDDRGGMGELWLFLALTEDRVLDDELTSAVRTALLTALSPRHLPDRIVAVPSVPRNITGKKLELPVKRILQGVPADQVSSRDALADPASLDAFIALAEDRR